MPFRLEDLAEVVNTPLKGCINARAAQQSVWGLQSGLLVIIGGTKLNALMLTDALHMSLSGGVGKTIERCCWCIFQ